MQAVAKRAKSDQNKRDSEPSFQTVSWTGPRIGVEVFFCVNSMGYMPISDEQAAFMMDVTVPQLKKLAERNSDPVRNKGHYTLYSVSAWIESRINNRDAFRRAKLGKQPMHHHEEIVFDVAPDRQ